MGWTEADSRLYQELAKIAVPKRAEQLAAVLTLLPFGVNDSARVVELSCGEGLWSSAILSAYPAVSVLALDGSAEMRSVAAGRLAAFGDRATVDIFELAAPDWLDQLNGANAVVSSLAIHHLDAQGKQHLFKAVSQRLNPSGALLIADLIEPRRTEHRELLAATWDLSAQSQSAHPSAFELFQAEHWNLYRYPDPVDMPSPLSTQLEWLREAGFALVDCFWLYAAHAIYGGYRAPDRSAGPVLDYQRALTIAQRTLAN